MTKIVIVLINFYSKYISPGFPRRCRYYPTCSEYALLAFKKYGFFKALFLSLKRLLTCHPYSKKSYYDPLK